MEEAKTGGRKEWAHPLPATLAGVPLGRPALTPQGWAQLGSCGVTGKGWLCTEGPGCEDRTSRLLCSMHEGADKRPEHRLCQSACGYFRGLRLWAPSGAGRVQAKPGPCPSLLCEKGAGEREG